MGDNNRAQPVIASAAALLVAGVALMAGPAVQPAWAADTALGQAQAADPTSHRSDRERLGFATSFDEKEFDRMVERLELDLEQVELAQAMFDGFRSAVSDIRTERREARDRITSEQADQAPGGAFEVDSELLERIAATQLDAQNNIDEVFADFETDLKSILTDEQAEAWPTYVREFRRRVGMRQQGGRGPGSVNLLAITDEMTLDAKTRDRLDPTLEAYANELDDGLDVWQRAAEEMREVQRAPLTISGSVADGTGGALVVPAQVNVARMAAAAGGLEVARLQLADINVRYIDAIAGQMPYEAGESFREAFNSQAYADIFGPTPADTYIDRVRALEDLTEAQVAGLDAIESDFDIQVGALNTRLLDARRKRDRERLHSAREEQRALVGTTAGGGQARGGAATPRRVGGGGGGEAAVEIQTITMVMTAPEGGGGGGGKASVLTSPESGPATVNIGPAIPDFDFDAGPVFSSQSSGTRSAAEQDLLQDKHELIVRTVDNVFALLTPEQQEAAPKPTLRPPLSMSEAMSRAMSGGGKDLGDGRRQVLFENGSLIVNPDGSLAIEMDGFNVNLGNGAGSGTIRLQTLTSGPISAGGDADAPDR